MDLLDTIAAQFVIVSNTMTGAIGGPVLDRTYICNREETHGLLNNLLESFLCLRKLGRV